ncbi:hypothetical protein SLA2020_235440 [Shorea laevis]
MAGPTAHIYEDFQPKLEQKEEQEAHVLHIHLPDFSREQMRVSYIDSTRTIRVQGERPLGKNKWSRFNRTFLVPENCSVNKIQARIQEGILTITIPKETIAPLQPTAAPKQEGTKITPKKREPSSALAPPPKEPSSVAAPPPKEPSPVAAPPPKEPSPVAAPPPKVPSPVAAPPPKVPSPVAAPPPKEPSPVEAPPPKAPSSVVASPPKEPSPVAAPKQSTEKGDSQTKDKEKMFVAPSKTPPPYDSKPKKQHETPPPLETKKEEKGKVKEETSFMETAKKWKNVAVAMMKTALEKKEDRHLIVNVGVAVLVIVAVGAYVTYKIRSSEKAED